MTNNKEEIIEYYPQGTCSKFITIKIKNDIIEDINIVGGCQGNLTGISNLVVGMKIDDVINKLNGIDCGGRGTSCPDQLAQCLIQYKNKQKVEL